MEGYRWRELDHGGGWVLYSYKSSLLKGDRFVVIHKEDEMAPWTYYRDVTAAEAIEMFRNQFWRNV